MCECVCVCVCVSHILLQISIRIINSDVTSYEYYIIGEEKAIIYNFLQSVKQHGGPTVRGGSSTDPT